MLPKGAKTPMLWHYRTLAAHSQRALAARAHVGAETVYRLENGGEARWKTIRALALALDLQPHELMGGSPPSP